MKTLYLVRHAKSNWDEPYKSDFERALTKSGMNDSSIIAELLYKKT